MFKQVFICGAFVAAFAAPSNAQRPPATEQAKQVELLVNKAAALVDSEGKAAFTEFRKKDSEWFHGDTFLALALLATRRSGIGSLHQGFSTSEMGLMTICAAINLNRAFRSWVIGTKSRSPRYFSIASR